MIAGARPGLRLGRGVLRRGLDAVDGLGWFGCGGCGACDDELAGCSVGCGADEQVVEVGPGEKLGENGAGPAGPVGSEDALIAGRTLDLHSGLGCDGLKNLGEGGVLGVNSEPAVVPDDFGGNGRLAGKRCGGLRGGFFLDGRGWFGCLRGGCRNGTQGAVEKNTGGCQYAPRTQMAGCEGETTCR